MSEIIVLTPLQLQTIIKESVQEAITATLQARSELLKQDTGKKYMSKGEAARLLGVSARTIEKRMASGQYRYAKQGGSQSSRVRLVAEDVLKSVDGLVRDRRFSR